MSQPENLPFKDLNTPQYRLEDLQIAELLLNLPGDVITTFNGLDITISKNPLQNFYIITINSDDSSVTSAQGLVNLFTSNRIDLIEFKTHLESEQNT